MSAGKKKKKTRRKRRSKVETRWREETKKRSHGREVINLDDISCSEKVDLFKSDSTSFWSSQSTMATMMISSQGWRTSTSCPNCLVQSKCVSVKMKNCIQRFRANSLDRQPNSGLNMPSTKQTNFSYYMSPIKLCLNIWKVLKNPLTIAVFNFLYEVVCSQQYFNSLSCTLKHFRVFVQGREGQDCTTAAERCHLLSLNDVILSQSHFYRFILKLLLT